MSRRRDLAELHLSSDFVQTGPVRSGRENARAARAVVVQMHGRTHARTHVGSIPSSGSGDRSIDRSVHRSVGRSVGRSKIKEARICRCLLPLPARPLPHRRRKRHQLEYGKDERKKEGKKKKERKEWLQTSGRGFSLSRRKGIGRSSRQIPALSL